MKAVKIAPGITWVGAQDFERLRVDAYIPVPHGLAYNAYLVVGKDRIALVDTVAEGFSGHLLDNIATVVAPERIDYIVMNHAEPDHGGALPDLLAAAPHATLVATRKGCEMAGSFYQVPAERRLAVREGDTLDLGGKTLRFVEAPWLHWPETMFTFAVEDSVLFTCALFSTLIASDKLFEDEVGETVLQQAKSAYAAIMMPYLKMVAPGLDRARALSPRIIAPGHGPVWRHPDRILDACERWVRGPLAAKVVVPYISMYGSTERLAQRLLSAIRADGVAAVACDLATSDIINVAADLVDASALIVGSPTLHSGLHPLANHALNVIWRLRPRLKLGGFFGSYGWGGGAAGGTRAILEPLGVEMVGAVDIKGRPLESDLEEATKLGHKIAQRVKDSLG